jgi:SSS family solute:Na+ symporter
VGKNLFDLGQSIICYLAPPMAAVFVVGIAWKRATPAAALTVLIVGSMASIAVGLCELTNWPRPGFWPHYLLLSFYLFAGLVGLMILISVLRASPPADSKVPTLGETYARTRRTRRVWLMWGVLAAIMAMLYLVFN